MQTLTEIRDLLHARGIAPKHRLGQNFLHDQNQLRKLVEAADVTAGECIVEVGPGTGTLTETLLEAGAKVIACELDNDMADIIEQHVLPGYADTSRLIRGDCLAGKHTVNPKIIQRIGRFGKTDRFKLVANLPYQIASPLLADLLIHHSASDAAVRCTGMYVTVQKEAAERIMAAPGSREYGTLSVLCQSYADVKQIAKLSPSCFWPAPKVDSVMIAIVPQPSDDSDNMSGTGSQRAAIAQCLALIFSQRRKQIGTIVRHLTPNVDLSSVIKEIDPTTRPESIAPSTLISLAANLVQHVA